jgi:hypothetical protein
MLGGPDAPAATLGAPDGMTVAGCDGRFEATTGLEERRLPAARLFAWCGFAARRGACTVMVGNVAGSAEGLFGAAGVGLAGAGVAASAADCAWAEAVYSNPGISTAVKAS